MLMKFETVPIPDTVYVFFETECMMSVENKNDEQKIITGRNST